MLDETTLLFLLGKIRSYNNAIVENLSYILKELPGLKENFQLVGKTELVCACMKENLTRCWREFSKCATTFYHIPSNVNARDLGAAAGLFLSHYHKDLLEANSLVQELRKSDQGLLEILVTESMTNILPVFDSLKGSLEGLQKLCTDFTEENSTKYLASHFSCALCRQDILAVSLAVDRDGKGMLRKNFDTYYGLDASSITKWTEALTENSELAFDSFDGEDQFCKTCRKFFCKEHWSGVFEHFDERGYDYTTAFCPSGHKSIIDD